MRADAGDERRQMEPNARSPQSEAEAQAALSTRTFAQKTISSHLGLFSLLLGCGLVHILSYTSCMYAIIGFPITVVNENVCNWVGQSLATGQDYPKIVYV